MHTERFTFPGHSGDQLAARLDLPDGPHLATALLAHCFTCGKDIMAARRIAARLAAQGIAVLRFDFTGLGHSGGEFENTSFTSNVDDLVAAAGALTDRGMAPSLIIGHSLGGAAVLRAAGQIPSIKAVTTIAAPFDPEHVTHNFNDALDDIAANGSGEVMLGGRPIRIGAQFVEDVKASELAPDIANLGRALLVMHAPRDETVGVDNATRIFLAAKHPKSFVTLDNADHLITQAADANYAADVIASWAGKYLDLTPPAPPTGAPEGITRVRETDPNGFRNDIQSGPKHYAIADEPTHLGGTDQGMTPYQLLSSALGACTTITTRMYARRKKWPMTHIAVDVTHSRVHAEDAAEPARTIDQFNCKLTIEGDLTQDQIDRLFEIAHKCPVHRTLTSGAQVNLELMPAAEAAST